MRKGIDGCLASPSAVNATKHFQRTTRSIRRFCANRQPEIHCIGWIGSTNKRILEKGEKMNINEKILDGDYNNGLLVLIRHLEGEVKQLMAENNELKAANAELTKANDFLNAIAMRGRDKLDENVHL